METIFYMHALIAVIAMAWAMFTPHAVHALILALVSLISIAISLYSLSAELEAALLIIIYSGAILILFLFSVMLLKPDRLISEKINLKNIHNLWQIFLSILFFGEILWVTSNGFLVEDYEFMPISKIAYAMFNTYGFYVEVISLVLLAGFVTTIFVGKNLRPVEKAEK